MNNDTQAVRLRARKHTHVDVRRGAYKYQHTFAPGECCEIGPSTWRLLEAEFRAVVAKGDIEIVDAPLNDGTTAKSGTRDRY